jgi:hypothetical protein
MEDIDAFFDMFLFALAIDTLFIAFILLNIIAYILRYNY